MAFVDFCLCTLLDQGGRRGIAEQPEECGHGGGRLGRRWSCHRCKSRHSDRRLTEHHEGQIEDLRKGRNPSIRAPAATRGRAELTRWSGAAQERAGGQGGTIRLSTLAISPRPQSARARFSSQGQRGQPQLAASPTNYHLPPASFITSNRPHTPNDSTQRRPARLAPLSPLAPVHREDRPISAGAHSHCLGGCLSLVVHHVRCRSSQGWDRCGISSGPGHQAIIFRTAT